MPQAKAKKSARDLKAGGKAKDVGPVLEEEFGNYRIKAGRLNGSCIARAFPKAAANSQGLIAETSGGSEQEAIASLKALIEARHAQRSAARRWEARAGISVPGEDEFIEALRQIVFSEPQLAMLKAHSIAGEAGMTSQQLATVAGYKSDGTASKTFRKAGGLIATFLDVPCDDAESRDVTSAAGVLAFCGVAADNAPAVWVMHEELRRAVWATL